MHPTIYAEFEKICGQVNIWGKVLEVGATPDNKSLLNLRALSGATYKVGVNLAPASRHRDYTVLQADGNTLCFPDNTFDLVLCNAVMEHNPFFWKMAAEIQRVACPGGLIVIGTPGYSRMRGETRFQKLFERFKFLHGGRFDALVNGTLTFRIHNYPGDYYRFSPQAYKTVIMAGLKDVQIRTVMVPPRIIASGYKPQ